MCLRKAAGWKHLRRWQWDKAALFLPAVNNCAIRGLIQAN